MTLDRFIPLLRTCRRHGLRITVLALSFSVSYGWAAEPISQDDFETDKSRVMQTFDKDISACEHYSGNKNDVCREEAKAKKTISLADLQAQLKNSPDARNQAEKEKVEANYGVARQLCEDMIEHDSKTMCNARAKADRDSAITEIQADRKVDAAKRESTGQQQDAELANELKKCDALPGDARNLCRENTRKLYGKS